uniref:Uncharacterized protein n=1 Tax=Ditylenchus dipsaci TaxID=166011 RepID=A0A915E5E5_9BILA
MVYSRSDNARDGRPAAYRSSNDRLAKSYRSPPPTGSSRGGGSRPSGGEHRSRKDSSSGGSECLSAFYRDRFGSHSPEDYLNLRMSMFDKALSKDNIRVLLEREFKHLAPFEIKIVRNPEDDERLAYINFERPECAKSVRRNMVPRLQKVLGRRIMLDPAGVIRDQEGKYIPDRYNRAAMAAADRDRSPRSGSATLARLPARRSPVTTTRVGYTGGGAGNVRRRDGQFNNLNQDDTQASRTLFVGNLPGDVRESELRRAFEVYGTVDDVDIKILSDSNAAYAFVLFSTVEESIDARRTQHNKPVRPGSTKCQIGYGKSQASARLYVGGLGTWTTPDLLMKEFDRYGPIDQIEFDIGDTYAYIKFTDADSAADACARMKNFDLGGKGKCITCDFAKDERKPEKSRKRGRSDSDDDYDSKRRGPRTPSVSPGRSPSEAGYIQTVDELKDQIASTWKGLVLLKKAEYPLSLYRVFGKEHLLQDILRDESGNSLKLLISQRLPLDNNFYQKMIDFNQRELALMVAVEGDRSAEPLVKYLQEKNAAGVITVNGGVVYVLSYSQVAERMLKFFAPRIALIKPNTNHLLIALKKTMPGTTTQPTVTPLPAPPQLPNLAGTAPPTAPEISDSMDLKFHPAMPEKSVIAATAAGAKNGASAKEEEESESGEDESEEGEEDEEEDEEEEETEK